MACGIDEDVGFCSGLTTDQRSGGIGKEPCDPPLLDVARDTNDELSEGLL